jgi:hypothetical protein
MTKILTEQDPIWKFISTNHQTYREMQPNTHIQPPTIGTPDHDGWTISWRNIPKQQDNSSCGIFQLYLAIQLRGDTTIEWGHPQEMDWRHDVTAIRHMFNAVLTGIPTRKAGKYK